MQHLICIFISWRGFPPATLKVIHGYKKIAVRFPTYLLYCVVPKNIHTTPTEGIVCTRGHYFEHPRKPRGRYWGREKVYTGGKYGMIKVKNGEKSPWGQCLTRQVPTVVAVLTSDWCQKNTSCYYAHSARYPGRLLPIWWLIGAGSTWKEGPFSLQVYKRIGIS